MEGTAPVGDEPFDEEAMCHIPWEEPNRTRRQDAGRNQRSLKAAGFGIGGAMRA